VQHIDEEAGLAGQEAVTPLQGEVEAGLQDVGGVRLLEAGAEGQEAVVDEQQLVPHAAGEVGQQPGGVARVPLLADAAQVTLEPTRTVGDDGRSGCTGGPMDSVGGLRGTHVHRIPLDDIDVDTPGHRPHTVGHQAGVLRRLLDVVDLQDAAVGIEVLPHRRGRIRLEEHPVAGPTVAQLGVPLDVIVAGG